MAKTQDFSIMRAPTPLILRALGVTVISDILFLALVLMIVEIRNVLGIDATLVGLVVLLFMAKTALVMAALFTVLNEWLKTSYFVSNNQLVIYRVGLMKNSSVYDLKSLKGVKFSKSSFGSKLKYGQITLSFSKGVHSEDVILADILNPDKVVSQLKNI